MPLVLAVVLAQPVDGGQLATATTSAVGRPADQRQGLGLGVQLVGSQRHVSMVGAAVRLVVVSDRGQRAGCQVGRSAVERAGWVDGGRRGFYGLLA